MTDDLKSSVISDRTMSTESLGKKSQRASPAKTTETAPTVLTTGLNDTDSPHSEDHHEILEASTFLKPNAVTKYLLSTSRDKSARPWPQVFLAGVIGGALLAMGGLLMITVAGGSSETLPPGLISLLAGLVFPVGLVMIVFSASDLLTSNMMYCAVPFFPLTPMEVVKPVSAPRWIELAKLLGLGFLGNLGGSALVASCAAYFSNLSAPAINYAIALAHKKGTLPAATLFIRAIGANWVGWKMLRSGYSVADLTDVLLNSSSARLPGRLHVHVLPRDRRQNCSSLDSYRNLCRPRSRAQRCEHVFYAGRHVAVAKHSGAFAVCGLCKELGNCDTRKLCRGGGAR